MVLHEENLSKIAALKWETFVNYVTLVLCDFFVNDKVILEQIEKWNIINNNFKLHFECNF